MRSYFPLCFLLATAELLLLHHIPVAAASVEATCKAASLGDPNINYGFCVASLRGDPRSNSADTKTLASIAVSLASASASRTNAKINALLSSGGGDAKTKEALKSCKSNYDDMTSTLSDVKGAMSKGDLGSAKTYLSAAMDTPGDCEEGFAELGIPSPLTKEDGNTTQLTTIALAITNML